MIEIRLHISQQQAERPQLLRYALINLGVLQENIAEKFQKGRSVFLIYEKSVGRANGLVKRIRGLKIKGLSVFKITLPDTDWSCEWKKYFKPFNITRDICIVPLWKKGVVIRKGSRPVYIDTTFAFGSGLHATTQMMAQLIFRQRGRFRSFLDVGTGSGILALIARQYGAEKFFALDNDSISVQTAQKNFKLNNEKPDYLKMVSFEKFDNKEQFDFVAANLLTEDLVRFRQKLISLVKPAKFLAVSGIYCENYPSFRRRFASGQIRCVRALKRKKWHAVLFQKKM
jgi:ribosomal protein L11 methyltransferase